MHGDTIRDINVVQFPNNYLIILFFSNNDFNGVFKMWFYFVKMIKNRLLRVLFFHVKSNGAITTRIVYILIDLLINDNPV